MPISLLGFQTNTRGLKKPEARSFSGEFSLEVGLPRFSPWEKWSFKKKICTIKISYIFAFCIRKKSFFGLLLFLLFGTPVNEMVRRGQDRYTQN